MAELIEQRGLSFLALDELAPFGVEALISTRSGGTSRPPYDSLNMGLHVGDDDDTVLANRALVADSLGRPLEQMVFLDQVHGTRVATVGPDDGGRGASSIENALSATDAAVTTSPDVTLVIQMADCAPLAFVDPHAGILGVAHAGWRGMVAGIGHATLDTMVRHGAKVDRIQAVIGPCVAADRYEVGREVIDAVQRLLGRQAASCLIPQGDTALLDLGMANRRALELAGVPSSQIHQTTATTSDRHLFFSDRHARPCGRFALFARLVSSDGDLVASGAP